VFEENRVSDRKIVPFRKRPPSGVELDVYRRMTRNWSAELRRLMFPEHARYDEAGTKGWYAAVVDDD
jgi:hypothetical protein